MNGGSLQQDRKLVQIAFILVPIAIAVLFFLISRELYAQRQAANKAVRRTELIQLDLYQLADRLEQFQSGVRGFLLTGDRSFLVPYDYEQVDFALRLALLKEWTLDSPLHTELLENLFTAVDQKRAELGREISLAISGDNKASLEQLASARSIELTGQVRSLFAKLHEQTNRLLAEQKKIHDSKLSVSEAITTALIALSAAVVVGAGILLLRIRQLQSIITICAWTQRVNYHGKWMRMEDFLWERFRVKVSHGISEEAFEGVMGIVGKKLTIPERPERPDKAERSGPPKAQADGADDK